MLISLPSLASLSSALPPCLTTASASSTGCIVVPCVTQGTLCQADTPPVNVWAGQLVDVSNPAVGQAYQGNVQAAAQAGHAVQSTAVLDLGPSPDEQTVLLNAPGAEAGVMAGNGSMSTQTMALVAVGLIVVVFAMKK